MTTIREIALVLPVLLGIGGLGSVGCARPEANQELKSAHQAYAEAANSPAASYAPDALAVARNSLARADRAHSEHDTDARSFAILARTRAEIADARGRTALAVLERDAARTRLAQMESLVALRAIAECQGHEAQCEGRQGATARQPPNSLEALADRKENARGGTAYVVSSGLQFPKNEATLTLSAKSRLDKVADALKSEPSTARVFVEGFTDPTGGPAINASVSQRRAAAVADYLRGRGIPQSIETRGLDSRQPTGDNATHAGRMENRRAEVLIQP